MDAKERELLSLQNAFNLLAKVLGEGENTFTKEDWQMLQVAQFLVSKEKFLKRDSDNVTLHYAFPQSFYFLDDLCENIYNLGRYVYYHDSSLIIDATKTVDYQIDLPPRFRELSNPTFSEALIIVNMIRNAIAHGQTEIDFDESLLKIDNSLLKPDTSGELKFRITADIPLTLLSKIDLGQIMKRNAGYLINEIFEIISNKEYEIVEDGVEMEIIFNGELIPIKMKKEVFSLVVSAYEHNKYTLSYTKKKSETIDAEKYKNVNFSLKKDVPFKTIYAVGPKVDVLKRNKVLKDLSAIMELINNDPKNALDTRISKRFFEIIESEYLPSEVKLEAIDYFTKIVNSINYHSSTERSFDSIAYAFGFFRQDKTIDFIALFNYMTQLFAVCPLKEGNALLTEFIDLSTIAIDPASTNDIDILGFADDIYNIVAIDFLGVLGSDPQQYSYQRPCINLYTKTLSAIIRKLKIRNNAYIRHIRNAIEHSNVSLAGDVVELRDYVESADGVEKTFRSRIHIENLVQLSVAYSNLYDVNDYSEYRKIASESSNSFLSFTFDDLFRELDKILDPRLIIKFKRNIIHLHEMALQEEFSFDESVADVMIKLANVSVELQNNKGKGGK